MYFIRHADKLAPSGVFDYGDPELSPHGRAQAATIGEVLSKLELGIVASSPSTRTLQTYQYAGLAATAPCRLISQSFAELNPGEAAGQSIKSFITPEIDEIAQQQGLHYRLGKGAESLFECGERGLEGLAPYKEDVGAVFLHGQTFKAIVGIVMGLDRRSTLDVPFRTAEVVSFDPFSSIPEMPISVINPTMY